MAEEPRSRSTPQPLKRHQTLEPLSREHMSGLIQARNLQRAADADLDARRAAVASFVEVWHGEMREHFDDEERILLPLTQDSALRDRLVEEHRVLRDLALRCIESGEVVAADPAALRRIGTLLHDHIRWEEREYFETIQREHPEALAALEHEADRIEERRPGARARRTQSRRTQS